jgi:hypothetical protein
MGRDDASGRCAGQAGIVMTPATSVSFFRPEFDAFLYASIGAAKDEMPLSVLSALARLNVDPWEEAAELSELGKIPAAQRLAALISQLPGGRWTQADSRTIADRLIPLLPRRDPSKVALAGKAVSLRDITGSIGAKLLICAALAATFLIIAVSREPSTPDYDRSSPSQTSRPSSR